MPIPDARRSSLICEVPGRFLNSMLISRSEIAGCFPTHLFASQAEVTINGRIFVSLPIMSSAEDNFRTILNALRAELDELDGRLRAGLAEWAGEARTAYDVAHADWQQAAADMATSLAMLQAAIGTAHLNYQSAWTANLRMWRGN